MRIEEKAFYACTSLAKANIGDLSGSIYVSAFEHCDALESIVIAEGCRTIGSNAFYGCDALASVTIPRSAEIIGSNALSECRSLTKIYYGGTMEEWRAMPKENLRGACTVYCTDGEVEL